MNRVKSLTLLLALAIGFTTLLNSCKQDLCKDVVCLHGGVCDPLTGGCDCVAGYEGTDCGTEMREKFVGSYQVSDNCSISGTSTYNVTVVDGAAVTQVSISNFWDAFVNAVIADIDGNTITIPSQEPDNDDFTVQGQGTYTAKSDGTLASISFSYTITDESIPISDVCTATWTKI
jgi:hypothetical protein